MKRKFKPIIVPSPEVEARQRELMTALLHEQVARAQRGDDRPSFEETCLKMDLAELNPEGK